MATQTSGQPDVQSIAPAKTAYETWIESIGIPIHRGYYLEDVRTIELGWWPERECNAAFLMLEGQEGVAEARLTEIPPGKTLPPMKFAFDELTYVVEGRGLSTVWPEDGKPKKTLEWQKFSLFMLPRNQYFQLSNTQGDRPVRLLHTNALPIGMAATPDPAFFFNNPYTAPEIAEGAGGFYSEAKVYEETNESRAARVRSFWVGNFFPDLRAWDKLVPFKGRGAGGTTVFMRYPGSPLYTHMSVFDAQTYKKGHRHGPGVVIIIPAGEGYSIMWPEGQDKVVVPWHEASVFVPPSRWFHQHFNVGSSPGRYLALHPARQFGMGERVADPRDQIEYPEEDPFVREKFAEELGKRGLKSIMPDVCYQDPNFEWDYKAYDQA